MSNIIIIITVVFFVFTFSICRKICCPSAPASGNSEGSVAELPHMCLSWHSLQWNQGLPSPCLLWKFSKRNPMIILGKTKIRIDCNQTIKITDIKSFENQEHDLKVDSMSYHVLNYLLSQWLIIKSCIRILIFFFLHSRYNTVNFFKWFEISIRCKFKIFIAGVLMLSVPFESAFKTHSTKSEQYQHYNLQK